MLCHNLSPSFFAPCRLLGSRVILSVKARGWFKAFYPHQSLWAIARDSDTGVRCIQGQYFAYKEYTISHSFFLDLDRTPESCSPLSFFTFQCTWKRIRFVPCSQIDNGGVVFATYICCFEWSFYDVTISPDTDTGGSSALQGRQTNWFALKDYLHSWISDSLVLGKCCLR